MPGILHFLQKNPRFTFWLGLFGLPAALVAVSFPELFIKGHIVFGDIDFGFLLENYPERIQNTWNARWSSPNFFNLSRLPVVFFIKIFQFLGLSASFFLKCFIFTLLWGSTAGMACLMNFLCHKFLSYRLKKRFLLAICLFSGAIYGLNPWVVMRIQHLYLLMGYVSLPFTFLFALKALFLLVRFRTQAILPRFSTQKWFPLAWKGRKIQFWHVFEGTKTQISTLLHQNHTYFQKKPFKNHKLWQNILLTVLFWVLGAGAVHYLFYSGVIIGFLFIFYAFREYLRQNFRTFQHITTCFGVILLLVIIFGGFGFLPQIFSAFSAKVTPNNINTIDSLVLFSRNASFSNVLGLFSYWWGMLSFPFSVQTWVSVAFIWFLTLFGLFRLRKNAFSWILALCLGLTVLLSMGTKGILGDFLIYIVFKSPISGTFGFLLRDPNKISGLLAFFLAISAGFGLGFGVLFWQKIYRFKFLETLVFKIVNKDESQQFWLKIWQYPPYFFIILAFLALKFWFLPIHTLYFRDFYRPVVIPQSYTDVLAFQNQNKQKNTTKSALQSKTLSFPRAESTKSAGLDFSSTKWHQKTTPKPVSGIDLFNASFSTYIPTEGSHPNVAFTVNFLENALLNSISTHVFSIFESLGVKNIAYHTDLLNFEQKNSSFISSSRLNPFKKEQKVNFWHYFSTKMPLPNQFILQNAIYSTSGLASWITLLDIPAISVQKHAFWFANNAGSTINALQNGDFFNFRFKEDAFLPLVGQEHRIFPFKSTLEANAFTRWAPNRATSADWAWHLEHAGVQNHFEGDNGNGLAFTYAPARLNLPPQTDIMTVGDLILDTSSLINAPEHFFYAEVPELLNFGFRPTQIHEDLPYADAILPTGDQKYWRVARSLPVPATERMGYSFGLTLSGKNTQNLHGKVKFFNEKNEEIGVGYVTQPHFRQNFDVLKFNGAFITPPETTSFEIQLWSHEPPKGKAYFWLHDLQIRQQGAYIQKNTLKMTHKTKKDTYQVWIRSLVSPSGGKITLKVPEYDEIHIPTQTSSVSGWVWQDLGEFNLKNGITTLILENLEGFNAVAEIILLPVEKKEQIQQKSEEIQQKTNRIWATEAETGLPWAGNIQSDKIEWGTSHGKALYLKNGIASGKVSIPEEGIYSFFYKSEPKPHGNIDFALSKEHVTPINPEKPKVVLEHSKKTENIPTDSWVYAGTTDVSEGEFKINLKTDFSGKSLVNTASLHPFLYENEWHERTGYLDTLGDAERSKDCCDCVDLGDNYLDIDYKKAEDAAKLKIIPGCSCWWVITASNMAEVDELEEFWINFDVRSAFARRNHFKIIFLDENKVFLDYVALKSTPNEETYHWVNIERIFQTMPQTKYVQFQIWSRENRFTESRMEIKNLEMHRLRDFPMIDSIFMAEGEHKTPESVFKTDPTANIKRENNIIQLNQSFSPLWQAKKGNIVAGNGFVQHVLLPKGQGTGVFFLPQWWYFLFLWLARFGLLILWILLGVLLYKRRKTRSIWQK